MQNEDNRKRRTIYSVSEFNRTVRGLLENQFPLLWIEGEISNLSKPASGHYYFTLKDEAAQVRCAMFKGRNQLLRFKPENGQKILLRARVSLYEARGDFQLIAEHMEEAGDGALQREFEALKARLAAEGLFDENNKRPIPEFPQHIGVVTSPSGAAIRDVLSVLKGAFLLFRFQFTRYRYREKKPQPKFPAHWQPPVLINAAMFYSSSAAAAHWKTYGPLMKNR